MRAVMKETNSSLDDEEEEEEGVLLGEGRGRERGRGCEEEFVSDISDLRNTKKDIQNFANFFFASFPLNRDNGAGFKGCQITEEGRLAVCDIL